EESKPGYEQRQKIIGYIQNYIQTNTVDSSYFVNFKNVSSELNLFSFLLKKRQLYILIVIVQKNRAVPVEWGKILLENIAESLNKTISSYESDIRSKLNLFFYVLDANENDCDLQSAISKLDPALIRPLLENIQSHEDL